MPTCFNQIVVPVDGTAHSERAVPVAAAVARRFGGEVKLVTVDSTDAARIAEALVHAVDDSTNSMLCMATHAETSADDRYVKTVGDRVLELGHHCALLVGPECDVSPEALASWLEGPINVFVSGADSDGQVAAVAMRWARLTARPIVFTTVLDPGTPPVTEAARVALLDELVAAAREQGLTAEQIVIESFDIVGTVLRTHRANHGSVVVGCHQGSALARKVAGSASIWTTHRARCPVVVAACVEPVSVNRRST